MVLAKIYHPNENEYLRVYALIIITFNYGHLSHWSYLIKANVNFLQIGREITFCFSSVWPTS